MLALAQERLLGEVVAILAYREYGALLPLLRLLVLGVGLIAQTLLVGNGGSDLLLGLDELLPHVDQDLIQHLLGVFGPRDQVVDVRPQHLRQSVDDTHGLTSPALATAANGGGLLPRGCGGLLAAAVVLSAVGCGSHRAARGLCAERSDLAQ